MPEYKRNHYVPEWYQRRFLSPDVRERKFFCLDLRPETIVNNGRSYRRNALLRWGPDKCFRQDDLYTTKFKGWESTEIEEKFFGKIDSGGRAGLDYITNFQHPSANGELLKNFLRYMSLQKLRTPKGLGYLANLVNLSDKNLLLFKMQELEDLFCALWMECIWSIADASHAETKIILSDHPVTVYNKRCFPLSKICRGEGDPGIWLSGTHTLFPLNLNKLLILTNLSWVRNPYGNPVRARPHPNLFRPAVFNFMHIQVERFLNDIEVNEINFVIKKERRDISRPKERIGFSPKRKCPRSIGTNLGTDIYLCRIHALSAFRQR